MTRKMLAAGTLWLMATVVAHAAGPMDYLKGPSRHYESDNGTPYTLYLDTVRWYGRHVQAIVGSPTFPPPWGLLELAFDCQGHAAAVDHISETFYVPPRSVLGMIAREACATKKG